MSITKRIMDIISANSTTEILDCIKSSSMKPNYQFPSHLGIEYSDRLAALEKAKEHLHETPTMIDLGSGDGIVLLDAHIQGYNAIGIELEPCLNDIARRNVIRAAQNGLLDIPSRYIRIFEQDMFDIVAYMDNEIELENIDLYYINQRSELESKALQFYTNNSGPASDLLLLTSGRSDVFEYKVINAYPELRTTWKHTIPNTNLFYMHFHKE